jgi:hypothetical protein
MRKPLSALIILTSLMISVSCDNSKSTGHTGTDSHELSLDEGKRWKANIETNHTRN